MEVTIAVIALLGLTGMGAVISRKLPGKLAPLLTATGTGMLALFAAVQILAFVVAKIMVTGWLVDTIDVTADQISALTSNQLLGLGVIFAILILNPVIRKVIERFEQKMAMKKMASKLARHAMDQAMADMLKEESLKSTG